MSKSLLPLTCAVLAALLAVSTAGNVKAQSPDSTGATTIGPVHLDWQHGTIVGTTLTLSDGVHMKSALYDLTCESLAVDWTSEKNAKGGASVSKATALGSPAKKSQVVGVFQQTALKRTYKVLGDKAVYVAEPGRAGGGRIDFTGHVSVIGLLPDSLEGPAVMHVEHATVSVGPAPKYPTVDFSAGSLQFTPLQH